MDRSIDEWDDQCVIDKQSVESLRCDAFEVERRSKSTAAAEAAAMRAELIEATASLRSEAVVSIAEVQRTIADGLEALYMGDEEVRGELYEAFQGLTADVAAARAEAATALEEARENIEADVKAAKEVSRSVCEPVSRLVSELVCQFGRVYGVNVTRLYLISALNHARTHARQAMD